MRAAGHHIAGLFGKLPSQGDFLNRGIPAAVERAWTKWLDGCLTNAKAELHDEYWLPTYLSSPPWRFALDAHLIAPAPVIGVLASSVDRVGRAYPFAGFMSLDASLTLDALDGPSEHPFADLEGIVLEAIDGAIDADIASARIGALAPQIATLSALDDPTTLRSPQPLDDTIVMIGRANPSIAAMVRSAALRVDHADHGPGWSCFWQNGWAGMAPTAIVSRGLPPANAFLGFLDGQWSDRGWMSAGGPRP